MPKRIRAIAYLARRDEDAIAAMRERARQNGWILDDVIVGGKTKRDACLRRLQRREANILMLARLRDVAPSLTDLTTLCRRSAAEGWVLASSDVPLRTDDSAGRAFTDLLAALMEFESKDLGDRVRRGIERRRAKGAGVGRPKVLASDIVDQIGRARADGWTYQAIADDLNARGIATAHGGARWHPSTVRKVITAREAVSA
jgi:DNA invertase Pin-like site-specific DNA recombinase